MFPLPYVCYNSIVASIWQVVSTGDAYLVEPVMSWSQTLQTEDLHDQLTILIGSAIRLLCGEAGVFVVSNEAFDPQSSSEYTLYRLSAALLAPLLAHVQSSEQPNTKYLLVKAALPTSLVAQLGLYEDESDGGPGLGLGMERCSLFVHDHAGMLGVLHAIRPAGTQSCFEKSAGRRENGVDEETQDRQWMLRLFMAQLAAGLRSTLKSQSLVKEQSRLAAIFQHSAEGILMVDNALRIIDFNPAMEQLTGWQESEVLGRFYYEVLRPKDRQGNEVGLDGSPLLQAFAVKVWSIAR